MAKKQKFNLKNIFFATTFVLACFTTNSDNLWGYWSNKGNLIIFLRYIMIFIFICFATIINKESTKFISKFSSYSTIVITAICIFDYYVTEFSGSQFLFRVWWIGAIFVAEASLFLTATALGIDNYKYFFKRFWIGFTPIYLFLFSLCFIRSPFSSTLTTNFSLGSGTFLMLKAFIHNFNVTFEAPLMFFGNLLIFIPLPFILYSVLRIKKTATIALIGIILPIIIEGYQYIFKCGDVDIDDIVLNVGGFIIGFIVFNIIKKKLLTKLNKSSKNGQ